MGSMSESQMSEVIERARKKVFETDRLVVGLANEAITGKAWKEREVKAVGEIHMKLQLVQRILLGETTAEDFGLQK